MSGRLSAKVCIVTGTGGSRGRATALTFAHEGALLVGCDVAVGPAEETLEAAGVAGGQMVSLLGHGLKSAQRPAGVSSIKTPHPST
jgi:NAD(P)-dependent dehydrogenase (short-subunit alcohol dehydrogenase family)